MKLAVAVVTLALGGCRFGFEPLALSGGDAATDGEPDGAGDAGEPGDAPDAAVSPGLCGIEPGAWEITAPVPLQSLADLIIAQAPPLDRSEFDPVIARDGLTLWFTSDQVSGFRVYRATRPSPTADFDTLAEEGADVNAAVNSHFGFQPLIDLGRAMITAPYAGELGGGDYWLGTFTTMWTWTATSLSTPDSDIDARMSATGLEVFLVRGATLPGRDIYRATRPDLDSDFGPATLVSGVNTTMSDSGPAPAPDDAGLFLVTDRAGSIGGEDIWYAERLGPGTYATPMPLTALNSATFDGEPTVVLTAAGCEVVFASDRDGSFDLYHAFVQRR